MDKPWLSQYPAGVPAEVDIHAFASLKDVLNVTCARFAERPAYDSMGTTMSFRQLDEASVATPVRTVVTTQVGDLLPPLKRLLTNAVVKPGPHGRWLAAHGRHGHHGRTGPLPSHRPQEGHDRGLRLQGLPQRALPKTNLGKIRRRELRAPAPAGPASPVSTPARPA